MTKHLFLLMAFLATPALAEGLELKSVTCGDHWFEVTAEIDASGLKAEVSFRGDGVDDDGRYEAAVVDAGDIVIQLIGRDDALVIDDFDAMHDLYWGSWKDGDRVTGLGLCSVESR